MAPARSQRQNGNGHSGGPNGNGNGATTVMVAPHLEVRESTIHGLGLFASRTIRKGMLIGMYEGPRTARNGSYVLWMEDDHGREYGINGKNALRYVNHCRQANAAFEDAELVARKTIQRGEEITHNYGDDWD